MKQVRRKKIQVRGVAYSDNGRPPLAYGRRCEPEEIDHEVSVAWVEIILRNRIERDVKVGKAEPDGVLVRDGNTCYLEVDQSGKMTVKKQMADKWTRYAAAKAEGFILVVAMTESRMQQLREWSDLVKDQALFTTLDRLRHGEVVGGLVRQHRDHLTVSVKVSEK